MLYLKVLLCSVIFWGVLFAFCAFYEFFDKVKGQDDKK